MGEDPNERHISNPQPLTGQAVSRDAGSGAIALELAVQDPRGIEVAGDIGADRIELCSGLALGGLTPSAGLVEWALTWGQTPVHVLIRPRAGDFEFDDATRSLMLLEVASVLDQGAHGVVVGATRAGQIDLRFLEDVVKLAVGRAEVTLHRVIDSVAEPVENVRRAAEVGVTRILTSGGADAVNSGIETIRAMVAASESRIQILAGGGLRLEDLPDLVDAGVHGIHTSAKEVVESRAAVALGSSAKAGIVRWESTSPSRAREFKRALHRVHSQPR